VAELYAKEAPTAAKLYIFDQIPKMEKQKRIQNQKYKSTLKTDI